MSKCSAVAIFGIIKFFGDLIKTSSVKRYLLGTRSTGMEHSKFFLLLDVIRS